MFFNVASATSTWRVHEVKVHKVINPKFLELQYNRSQVGAKDLWIGVLLHLILIGFFCTKGEKMNMTRA